MKVVFQKGTNVERFFELIPTTPAGKELYYNKELYPNNTFTSIKVKALDDNSIHYLDVRSVEVVEENPDDYEEK